MKIPDYYVRTILLPPTIRGVTLPNDDGTFSIYINSQCDEPTRREALEHELEHMARDHFYKDESVGVQEQEANGLVRSPAATPRKRIRRYEGLRGMERALRRLDALPPV